MKKFEEFSLGEDIIKALEALEYNEPTEVQEQVIPKVLLGKDLMVKAQTGTGKTASFVIPLCEKVSWEENEPQVLILSPTRELAIQIGEDVQNIGRLKRIKGAVVYGKSPFKDQARELKGKCHMVIGTPGRVQDHIDRETINTSGIKYLVIDEADEMLNMGFREDLDVILSSAPEERQTVLFSATLSKDILAVAKKYQRKDAVMVKITRKEVTVPTIKQYYLEVTPRNRVDVLMRLMDTTEHKLSLIFCNTKRRVDELANELLSRGYAVDSIHGDMKQMQRDRVMRRFKSGLINTLIATDVAARGLDIDDIEAVYNFDVPDDEEYYVHRIGRTGRAMREGVSYTFVSGREMWKLREIMSYTKAKIERMQAPGIEDVKRVRVEQVTNNIETVINNGLKYKKYVENYINNSDVDVNDICAALLQLVIDGNDVVKAETPKEKLNKRVDIMGKQNSYDDVNVNIESELTGAKQGMVRLFVSVGKLDRVKRENLVEMLGRVGLYGKNIGVVDVYDKFSFIEVGFDHADKVISMLDGTSFKGRPLSVEKAQRKAGSGSNRSSSRRRRR